MAALHWPIHTRSPHSSIKRLFLFFLTAPLFCSFPRRFSFLPIALSSPHHRGTGVRGGGIMTPTGSFFWRGGFREKRPLCSPILLGSTQCPLFFCFFFGGSARLQQVVSISFCSNSFFFLFSKKKNSVSHPHLGVLLKGQFAVTYEVSFLCAF